MGRRLGSLAGFVCGLCLVVGCTSDAVDPLAPDRVYGPQPRDSASAWPGVVGVEIGDQPATWWPVSSAHGLRSSGIDAIASSAVGGMVADGAGAVWVEAPWGMVRLDPVTWAATVWDAGDDAAFASTRFVRASSGSGVWLVGQDRARLFDGVRFVRDIQVPSAYLGTHGEGMEDLVEVGHEVWIAGQAGVARCDGHIWSMVGEGQLDGAEKLAVTPWGEVWARLETRGGLLRWMRYDGTRWRPTDRPDYSTVDAIAWDPTGGIVATSGPTVMHYDGSAWQVLLRLDREVDGEDASVEAVAASGDGTVWAVTGEALLRSADRADWHLLRPPDGTSLMGVAVSGDEVVVSADTGVYRVSGEDLERVWSPGEGSAIRADIVDVVAVSGDRAWVVAADWSGESVVYHLHELQVGRRDPVRTRSLPASVARAHLGWPLSGLGTAAVAASDGAVWYVTEESVTRIADGTESVVSSRTDDHVLGEWRVNVDVVATGEGGPERADPRPREIGPDAFAELTFPGPTIEQTLYGDGDITCSDHWAHDLSLPVGQVQYTPTPEGIEITVTLTGAWPDTGYYVEVNTDEVCARGTSPGPQFEGLVTDGDGAGSLTLTYTGTPTERLPRGILAGDDGAVWVLSTRPGWRQPGEERGWEGLRLLAPDGASTQVDLPAPALDIMLLAVGPGGHLWATVCEGGTEPGGYGLPTCPRGQRLMHRETGWVPVPYPGADVWGLGAAPDGSFWAILAQKAGQFDHGVLAHYREGTWTPVPELADLDPYDTRVTPAGSVCRIEVPGPTLACVDTSLRVTRTPVAMTGNVSVAADGTVWVWDHQLLARMPITAPS